MPTNDMSSIMLTKIAHACREAGVKSAVVSLYGERLVVPMHLGVRHTNETGDESMGALQLAIFRLTGCAKLIDVDWGRA